MKFKAVIFDLDGTLLNTLDDIGDSVNRVLNKKGFKTHEIDKYREFVGDGSKILITRALPQTHRTDEIINECLEEFFKDYGSNWDKMTHIYNGIAELLDELTIRNLKLAILSNKRHDLTIRCMEKYFSRWHFDSVLGLRDTVPKKPHPVGAFETADILKILPEKIIYAGDSANDIKTAVAAGMFPVGVLWGFRGKKELKESGAKALIGHPMDLLNIQEICNHP